LLLPQLGDASLDTVVIVAADAWRLKDEWETGLESFLDGGMMVALATDDEEEEEEDDDASAFRPLV
jgi:hypothetical protein